MTRLIPMVPVRSMPVSVEFYQKLGFAVERREDRWGWAMLRCDECRLMVDESIHPHRDGAPAAVIYLYPEDIVEYQRRLQANGLVVPNLSVTFYGMNEFRIEDPDGNQLWIGQSKTNA